MTKLLAQVDLPIPRETPLSRRSVQCYRVIAKCTRTGKPVHNYTGSGRIVLNPRSPTSIGQIACNGEIPVSTRSVTQFSEEQAQCHRVLTELCALADPCLAPGSRVFGLSSDITLAMSVRNHTSATMYLHILCTCTGTRYNAMWVHWYAHVSVSKLACNWCVVHLTRASAK